MKHLDRHALEALVRGTDLCYTSFGNELAKKAGHHYIDAYGKTTWNTLNRLTDEELYDLYVVCKNSWNE